MLTIRNQQFAVFRKADWRSFLHAIAADARRDLALRGTDQPLSLLEPAAEQAVRVAQSYGFRTRPDLQRFALILLVHGPEWETPDVRAALLDNGLSTETKLARLEAGAGRS